MTRVATFVSNQVLVDRMLDVQARVQKTQIQVATERKSTSYAGISMDALRLINFENQRDRTQRYMDDNVVAQVRLDLEQTAANTSEQQVREFRQSLLDFSALDVSKASALDIDNIQILAFNTMKDIESNLNVRAEGEYLFSGGRTDVEPVQLPFTSLADLQTKFPGTGINFPTSRLQQMSDVMTAATAGTLNYGSVSFTTTGGATGTMAVDDLTVADYTSLSFNTGAGTVGVTLDTTDFGSLEFSVGGTITFADTAAVRDLAVGMKFTVAGATSAGNDQTYTITGKSNGVLTVVPPPAVAAPADAFPTVSFFAGNGTIVGGTANTFDLIPVGGQFTIAGSSNALNDLTYTVISKNGGTVTVTPPPAGAGTDNGGAATITPHVFSHIPVGTTFTTIGAGALNDAETFSVTANDGKTLTISTVSGNPVTALAAQTPEIRVGTSNTYYQGDQLTLDHRLEEDRTITLGLNASHAGFEKAIRAMGLIAQGDLANHPDRVDLAISLLTDSLTHDEAKMPDEDDAGIEDLQRTLARSQVLLDSANTRHVDYLSFLEVHISKMEDVDMTQAVTQLNDDVTALEIAMKTMARITQLSLADYI